MKVIQKKQYLSKIIICLLMACFLAGLTSGNMVMAETTADTPKGPEYNADSSQVTFTNIYFGSYPQSEVKGSSLTSCIQNASYDSYGDAWVDGIKYRRIRKSDTNNDEQFGSGTYRYFKWERISWRVLGNDGDTLFVMANQGLDCHNYHEVDDAVTWADCSLRKWVNGAFYYTAFSSGEREAIKVHEVDNDSYGNGNTSDSVYIPSMAEMSEQAYGFLSSLGTASPSRQIVASDYAYVMGARTGDENGKGEQCCWWWMRDPAVGEENALRYAALMGNSGAFSLYGRIQSQYRAVVPVLHICLSSDTWYRMDDQTSGAGGGASAAVPLSVSDPSMLRSANVASFRVEAKGGITSDYTYQWYYAPSDIGSGYPLGALDYKAIVWQKNALYVDLKANDVPDGLYLYCTVSDGRTTVTSGRKWFSKKLSRQTIIYDKSVIQDGNVEYGASFNLNAKSNGKQSKITYKSSNQKVLTINESGEVKVKGYGKAIITITASASYVENYGRTSKKINVTVYPKKVQLTKIKKNVDEKGTLQSIVVKWKKDTSADGFQYNVAYNSKYTTGANSIKQGKVNSIKLLHIDVTKKKLYIRVRAFKKVSGRTYYGNWSNGYILKL